MLEAKDIYHFRDYRSFLQETAGRHFTTKRGRPTLREWASYLGYRCHRSVGRVLSGERLPSREMVERISKKFQLSDTEHRYFELLVERERRSRNQSEVEDILDQLSLLNPGSITTTPINPANFSYIANWYHLVLKQVLLGERTKADPQVLARKLRNKVKPEAIAEALSRMVRLGVITRNADGTYEVIAENLRTEVDVPSESVRIHHKQMLKRAWEALDEQPVGDRENISHAIKYDKSQTPEIKQFIRRFRDEFDKRFATSGDGNVGELIIHFFSHTTGGDS